MGYGLTSGDVNSDRVNYGSPAALDNVNTGTFLAWRKPTNVTPGWSPRYFQKGLFGTGNYHALAFDAATGRLSMSVQRATTSLEALAALANFTHWSVGTKMGVAATWDVNGVNADQKIYVGNLANEAAEPSAYVVQVVGSGVAGDDSAADFILSSASTFANAFVGDEYIWALYNSVLNQDDIRKWFKRPCATIKAGCLAFVIEGNDGSTGAQVDLVNGNNGTQTGMVAATDFLPLALHGDLVTPRAAIGRSLVGGGYVR